MEKYTLEYLMNTCETQSELASKLEVTRSAVNLYLKKDYVIPFKFMKTLAAYQNVPVWEVARAYEKINRI